MLKGQMTGNRRAVATVLIACGVAFGLCGVRWALRLTRPTDGLMINDYTQLFGQTGVRLLDLPYYPFPIGFRSDDVIVAMNNRSLDEWGHDLFDPTQWGQHRLPLEQPIEHRLLRDGQWMTTPVTLGIHPYASVPDNWGLAIFAVVYLAMGVFVFLQRPAEPAARALLVSSSGGFVFNIVCLVPSQISDLSDPLTFWYVRMTINGSIFLSYASLMHFALVFPRPPQSVAARRWLIPAIYASPFVFFAAFVTLHAFNVSGVMAWYAQAWPSGLNLTLLTLLASLPVIAVARYAMLRDADDRRRLRWLLIGGFTIPMLSLLLNRLPATLGLPAVLDDNSSRLLYSLFPILLGVSILRYRLWDIAVIVNRALVYGTLTISITAIYLVIVVIVGNVLYSPNHLIVSLVATGLVAIIFQPGRALLQRGVNHLMYGERDDPYAVIARLGRRLETTFTSEEVLPTIAETVGQALKLPYAALALKRGDGFEIAATYAHGSSSKDDPATRLVIPLTYQQATVGQLILAPRSPHESFSPADRRLLDDLARQAGLAAYNVSLAAELMNLTLDLQRSRERLVTIREEERRRLSRDLHDGLGPVLAGLHLNVNAARGLLWRDADCADQVLGEMQSHLANAMTDVGRLVYELRPPLLDALGLVAAIRHFAEDLVMGEGQLIAADDRVRITIKGPESLPPLPAAVEVAAYRIALEAMTNVVRHARARSCVVQLTVHRQSDVQPTLSRLSVAFGLLPSRFDAADRYVLCVDVVDDGIGFAPETLGHAGIGLASMRERAAELGGVCVIGPNKTGGTHVTAYLPIADPNVQTRMETAP
jgi:signal transduction histidine kinase